MGSSDAPMNAVVLYVFGEPDGSTVKLGYTEDIRTRQQQHERRGPVTVSMRLLAALWGMQSDEGSLKRHWKHLDVTGKCDGKGEWFHADEAMRGWLRWLRDQPFVTSDRSKVDAMPYVDSSHWLPGVDRVKYVQPQLALSDDPWDDLETAEIMEGDYYTDPRLTAAARQTMGAIDLDPASCKAANEDVRAARFFGWREDGLLQRWKGRVWLNPPFGQWDLWVPKALEAVKSGDVSEMCIFSTVNTATSKQFHPLIQRSDAILIPCGRYSCHGPKSSSAQEGCFILYIGPNRERFADAFGPFGTIVRQH